MIARGARSLVLPRSISSWHNLFTCACFENTTCRRYSSRCWFCCCKSSPQVHHAPGACHALLRCTALQHCLRQEGNGKKIILCPAARTSLQGMQSGNHRLGAGASLRGEVYHTLTVALHVLRPAYEDVLQFARCAILDPISRLLCARSSDPKADCMQ